jgi:hypothetical protein
VKTGLQQERTAVGLPGSDGGAPGDGRTPKDRGARWAAIAMSLVVVALTIGTFATLHGSTGAPESRPVYLDPMTGVREGGPYVQPVLGPWVDGLTGLREGSGYATTSPTHTVGALTGIREAGPYATRTNQDAMTSEREGGEYVTPAP